MVAEMRRATNWTPPKCDGCGDVDIPLAPWPVHTRNGVPHDLFCRDCHDLRAASEHDVTYGDAS